MQKIIDKYNKKLATFSSNDINFRGGYTKSKNQSTEQNIREIEIE